MYNRLISLQKKTSLFLFGQRGTGKSFLLRKLFNKNALFINLLDTKYFLTLRKEPWVIRDIISAREPEQQLIIIDEIQKIPELLNEVHLLIEEQKIHFILTGSSARKLKKSGANLLAGRALDFKLYPLTFFEQAQDFNLETTLQWGSLPTTVLNENNSREEYLYAYINSYLKEEIIAEQVLRQMEPFMRFLEIAAAENTNTINYENIAKDTKVSAVTVKSYYQILEDTLLGFYLLPYHKSVRKKQKQAPKFYFHDLGLVRTLQNTLQNKPTSKSFEYGLLFESFLINEIIRLNEYKRTRFKFSFLRISDQLEVDLIIGKPTGETILIEIKSTTSVSEHHLKGLKEIHKSFPEGTSAVCLSQDKLRKKVSDILCIHWEEWLRDTFDLK